jgi:hypothetical protein
MTTRSYDFPDGFTNATAPVFGGGIGSGSIEPFQELIGTGDGVTTTFNTTHAPYTDNSVLVLVNGVQRDKGTAWTLSGNTITFLAGNIPADGQYVYVYYFRLTGGGGGGGGGANVKTEYRVISGAEATAKSLTLIATPTTPGEVILGVSGGGLQFFGDDFTVYGSTLSWNGLALDGILTTGDKLIINYSY